MSKSKKTLLYVVLIIMLIVSMFALTGCGNTYEDLEEDSNEPAQSSSTADESVIEVPMTVANLYPNTTITELYLSGSGLDNWGEDLLNGQTMPTGTQLSMVFNINEDNIKWDIKAVDEEGTEIEFRNLDLSEVSTSGGTISLTSSEDGSPIAVAQ